MSGHGWPYAVQDHDTCWVDLFNTQTQSSEINFLSYCCVPLLFWIASSIVEYFFSQPYCRSMTHIYGEINAWNIQLVHRRKASCPKTCYSIGHLGGTGQLPWNLDSAWTSERWNTLRMTHLANWSFVKSKLSSLVWDGYCITLIS